MLQIYHKCRLVSARLETSPMFTPLQKTFFFLFSSCLLIPSPVFARVFFLSFSFSLPGFSLPGFSLPSRSSDPGSLDRLSPRSLYGKNAFTFYRENDSAVSFLVDSRAELCVVFFFIFFSHTHLLFQLLDKPWSQVSSLRPPPVLAFNFFRA